MGKTYSIENFQISQIFVKLKLILMKIIFFKFLFKISYHLLFYQWIYFATTRFLQESSSHLHSKIFFHFQNQKFTYYRTKKENRSAIRVQKERKINWNFVCLLSVGNYSITLIKIYLMEKRGVGCVMVINLRFMHLTNHIQARLHTMN